MEGLLTQQRIIPPATSHLPPTPKMFNEFDTHEKRGGTNQNKYRTNSEPILTSKFNIAGGLSCHQLFLSPSFKWLWLMKTKKEKMEPAGTKVGQEYGPILGSKYDMVEGQGYVVAKGVGK